MSKAKKCDRCGAFYEEKHQIFSSVIENNGITINIKDLCNKCEKELIDWLEMRNGNEGDTQDKD